MLETGFALGYQKHPEYDCEFRMKEIRKLFEKPRKNKKSKRKSRF